MPKEITHRDEIHGDVHYDPLALALLDTPALQRLGRVYQLGYGHLVYRGGTHTRLSHSLGTYAAAGRLVDALRASYERRSRLPEGALTPKEFLPDGPGRERSEQQRELSLEMPELMKETSRTGELADRWDVLRHLVCWAALLHDVGHVPLGHTLEDEFEGIYDRHDNFSSPRLSYLWVGRQGELSDVRRELGRCELYPRSFRTLGITDSEDVWGAVLLICVWKESVEEGIRTRFEDILGATIDDPRKGPEEKALAERLRGLCERLTPRLFAPYMADLVANTISADYLDYVRRDPHNLGLDVLRDDRVASQFVIGRDHLGQARMALRLSDRRGKPRLDTCTGVVDLVRQRYRFAEIVYYHKTKVAASVMLAKVFNLVGKPLELPAAREIQTLADAKDRAGELVQASGTKQRKLLGELEANCTPASLLDPEIGDESLGMLLRSQALSRLRTAVGAGEQRTAADALRAIALLDALARRELYKVCFSMNAKQFEDLRGAGQPGVSTENERLLKELIEPLRGDQERRAEVEALMVEATTKPEAAGMPEESLLLYVPPRKSQAKGILTGALMDGVVVTLGDHAAVSREVTDLSKHYLDLWRLIILVHPDHALDAIGLSDAVDAFIGQQFPNRRCDTPEMMSAIERCCWFQYIRPDMRAGARMYANLSGLAGRSSPDWERLDQFERVVGRLSSADELAQGATLADELCQRTDADRATLLLGKFAQPGALLVAVGEQTADDARGREGEEQARLSAIQAIAADLCA